MRRAIRKNLHANDRIMKITRRYTTLGDFLRKTAFILLFAVLLTANVRAEGNVPSVSAAAWAVCDVTSGRILAGGNADQVLPMASTTKIMTALIACEEYRADTEITITPECYAEGPSM